MRATHVQGVEPCLIQPVNLNPQSTHEHLVGSISEQASIFNNLMRDQAPASYDYEDLDFMLSLVNSFTAYIQGGGTFSRRVCYTNSQEKCKGYFSFANIVA